MLNFYKDNFQSKFILEAIGLGVFIAIFLSLLLKDIFFIPFSFADEHRIMAMLNPGKISIEYLKSIYGIVPDLKGSFILDYKIGRFRPASWIIVKLQTLFFKDNVEYYYYYNIIIAGISCAMFYLFLRLLNINKIISIVTVIIFISGKNSETFWNLIPPLQNTGDLFLLTSWISLLLFLKKKNTIFFFIGFVFLSICAFSKESLALAALCTSLVFSYLLWYRNNGNLNSIYLKSVLLLSVPSVSLVIVGLTILNCGFIYGYAYTELPVQIITYNLKEILSSSFFLLSTVVCIILYPSVFNKKCLWILLFFLILFLSLQLIVHKGVKMNFQHHHKAPSLLVLLTLTGLTLQILNNRKAIISGTVLIFYILFSINNIKNTYNNSQFKIAMVNAYEDALNQLVAGKDHNIAYVSILPVPTDWLMGTSLKIGFKTEDKKKFYKIFHEQIHKDSLKEVLQRRELNVFDDLLFSEINASKIDGILFEIPFIDDKPFAQIFEKEFSIEEKSKDLVRIVFADKKEDVNGKLIKNTRKFNELKIGTNGIKLRENFLTYIYIRKIF